MIIVQSHYRHERHNDADLWPEGAANPHRFLRLWTSDKGFHAAIGDSPRVGESREELYIEDIFEKEYQARAMYLSWQYNLEECGWNRVYE